MKANPDFKNEIGELENLLDSIRPLPGEAFYTRMDSAPWIKPAPPAPKSGLTGRRLALAVFLGVLLLSSLGFTPPGRILVNEIVHFFNRAQGDSFPLSPEQIQPPLSTATPQPTYFPVLLPAAQAAATPAKPIDAPTPALPAGQLQNLDSMSVRTLVDFDLLEPISLPRDYRLQNIRYDPDQQAVIYQYASPQAGTGEFFSLSQGKKLAEPEIGASAEVRTLEVAGKSVELVQGGWMTLDGAATSTWEKDIEVYTLRWVENGIFYSLNFFLNETSSPAYLDADERAGVIASLKHCQAEDYTCAVSQASAAAGFVPWQFPQVPEGYVYKSVYYQPGTTAIWYGNEGGELGVLQSRDSFEKSDRVSDWFSVPEDAIQKVSVGGQAGEYVNGSFVAKPGEDHATWAPDSGQIRLRWQRGDGWFQIVKWGEPVMEPQQLADLAAGLTQTTEVLKAQPQSQPETGQVNEAYLSIDEAEKVYDQKVLRPAVLPDGLPFSHARIFGNSVMLFYGSFAADKMRSDGAVLTISQGSGKIAFDESYKDYPPGSIEDVTVNGVPGKMVNGTLMISYDADGKQSAPEWKAEPFTLTLIWENEGRCYAVQFHAGDASGVRIRKEDLIAIAESLK
jgi:hypothetical protein